jgi:glycosyltransferase involved in cell wall biosynthesis
METGWTIVALGDGPDREPLMSEASDLVESGSVTFPEGGLEVIPRIASADIGVLLTDPKVHIEGCSNSIMEYMACGLPVVCTDSGGNREIVEDGVTGFVVPAYDAGAVVAAVRKLRNDPARSREMGHQGSRRLRECFTIERMVAGFVSAYESALAPRGPAGRRAAQRGPST